MIRPGRSTGTKLTGGYSEADHHNDDQSFTAPYLVVCRLPPLFCEVVCQVRASEVSALWRIYCAG